MDDWGRETNEAGYGILLHQFLNTREALRKTQVGNPLGIRAWALFSGGKDSITLTHWLQRHDALEGVVAFDTGISVPEWEPFIRETCQQQGWLLTLLKTSASYDDLVRKYGFPGPGAHSMFMNYLKGRCIRQFVSAHPGTLLASGVRRGESVRRFRSVRDWSSREGAIIWAPLANMTTKEVMAYVGQHGLPRSPAYATLGISGDCLCGAFARPDERGILATYYPTCFARITSLEQETGGTWGKGKARRGKISTGESLICVECHPTGEGPSGTR